MPFATIPEALAAIRAGKMIILCDDEDRENEGDLCMAAEKVTPEAIAFMARFGCGLICLTMNPERLDQLRLPLMVEEKYLNFDKNGAYATAFLLAMVAVACIIEVAAIRPAEQG